MTNPDREYRRKVYLGDGVYAQYDGYHIWLTVEDGIHTLHTIGIEPIVRDALKAYIEKYVDRKET